MRKAIKKSIAIMIATLTVFSSTISALAAETNQNYGIETDNAKTIFFIIDYLRII